MKYAILAFLLALLATGGTVAGVTARANKIAHPIRVIQAVRFVPAGQPIVSNDLRWTVVYAPSATGLETSPKDVLGKAAAVPLVAGQLLYRNDLGGGIGVPSGDVGLYLPVTLSQSALAMPGDQVNVYWVHQVQNTTAPAGASANQLQAQNQEQVLSGAEVLASVDNQGNEITTGSGILQQAAQAVSTGNTKLPSAVEVAVSQSEVQQIISDMDQGGNFYLAQVPGQS